MPEVEILNFPLQETRRFLTQSNKLIEARFRLTQEQQRFVLGIASEIKKGDTEFKRYRATEDDLKSFFSIDSKKKKTTVRDILFSLQDEYLYIEDEETGDFFRASWVSSVAKIGRYYYFSVDISLKPFLLELNEQFTTMELDIAACFSSFYSTRIYSFLAQYKNIGFREMELEDFRKKLVLNPDPSNPKAPKERLYNNFKSLRQWVLNQAKKEFEKRDKETGYYQSDLTFDLKTRRTGRKVSHLIFIIKRQTVQPVLPLPLENDSLLEIESQEQEKNISLEELKENKTFQEIKKLGIREQKSLELFEEYGEDKIKEKLKVLEEMQETKEIKSPSGFLLKALKDNYQSKKTVEKAKQKEVKEKQAEEAKKKKIKSLTQDLEIEFGNMARKNFLHSRSETQKAEIQLAIIKELEGTPSDIFISTVKKDLGSRKIGAFLNKHIPNFEEDKKIFIQEGLKEKGLI